MTSKPTYSLTRCKRLSLHQHFDTDASISRQLLVNCRILLMKCYKQMTVLKVTPCSMQISSVVNFWENTVHVMFCGNIFFKCQYCSFIIICQEPSFKHSNNTNDNQRRAAWKQDENWYSQEKKCKTNITEYCGWFTSNSTQKHAHQSHWNKCNKDDSSVDLILRVF